MHRAINLNQLEGNIITANDLLAYIVTTDHKKLAGKKLANGFLSSKFTNFSSLKNFPTHGIHACIDFLVPFNHYTHAHTHAHTHTHTQYIPAFQDQRLL